MGSHGAQYVAAFGSSEAVASARDSCRSEGFRLPARAAISPNLSGLADFGGIVSGECVKQIQFRSRLRERNSAAEPKSLQHTQLLIYITI